MLTNLQKLFPSLITTLPTDESTRNLYQWYMTDHQPIGILKSELTTNDIALLSTFLTPNNMNLPILTEEEKKWKRWMNASNEEVTFPSTNSPYRFVYFRMDKSEMDPFAFNEAIQTLFPKTVPILWENELEGIIVEEQSIADEDIDYRRIIDVLISDLYVNIKFFVGLFQNNLNDISAYYTTIKETANTVFNHSQKSVITYPEAIPYILLNRINPSVRKQIISSVLREFAEDTDMIHTIQTLFHCNLNVSVTAKELYMHRNSLQYRIDKFCDQTGIDLQQFDQAQAVYLALLCKNYESGKHA
ncbi:PucR family transcriptional regulator [Virgibacillus sp. W0181]|uniref:PucR family transcriptional regulator n=1 Tax=Virgibacillus sp. W0181 TaxID=3391581 RepID=UPI003F46AE67